MQYKKYNSDKINNIIVKKLNIHKSNANISANKIFGSSHFD